MNSSSRTVSFYSCLCVSLMLFACESDGTSSNNSPVMPIEMARSSIGIVGNPEDTVTTNHQFGIVLMGGSTDVDEAMQWMIDRAGGGDFVVIRASGSTGYNQYLYDFGNLHSVETLRINSKELANDAKTAEVIRNAEALFIAGGDQYDYVSFWKDTPVEDAINFLINEKKAPVGGTSAGCAILGEIVFDAAEGTIYSDEALEDPYNFRLSLQRGDFLAVDFLKDVVTDTHYAQRDRQGRHIAFLARMAKDWGIMGKGIGVNERTAVAIDETGKGVILGTGTAYFLWQNAAENPPEVCEPNTPLTWDANGTAVRAYVVPGNNAREHFFDLTDWEGDNHTGGLFKFFYSQEGQFKQAFD